MRKSLMLSILFLAAQARAQTAPSADAFKGKFSADEQWLLAVVLSVDKEKAAFDAEASAASAQPDQDRFMHRWRAKVAGVAVEYKKLLETPIVPNAPSIEKMVSENEFNLTNYWLMYQPAERQKQILSDIKLGNAVIGFRRGDVEEKISENRKSAASGIGTYLGTAPVKAALAYKEPPAPAPQKPSKAIDQAEEAARKAEQAKNAPTPEQGADKADQSFSGKPNTPGEATPVDGTAGAKQTLPPSQPGAIQGGLTFRPPPKPMLDRENPAKESTFAVIAKKFGPAVGGGLLGGLLGFLLGGPIGMIIGAAIGGFGGYKLGKALLE